MPDKQNDPDNTVEHSPNIRRCILVGGLKDPHANNTTFWGVAILSVWYLFTFCFTASHWFLENHMHGKTAKAW